MLPDMQIALDECRKGSEKSEYLEEIWFAFFEKAVFNAFVEAADEMLQPIGEVSCSAAAPCMVNLLSEHALCLVKLLKRQSVT